MATLKLLYGNPTKYGEAGLTVSPGSTAAVGKLVRMGTTGRWVLGSTGAIAGVLYSQDLDPYTGDANTLDKVVVLCGPGMIIETDQFESAAGLVPGAEVQQTAGGRFAVAATFKKIGRVLAGGYGHATVTIVTYF